MKKLVSSKHLEGVSDLTLAAPIKQGFIDAFEAATYETRLRLVMKALFGVRQTAREHSRIKPFVDTAERIQTLLDFRLAIHGNELLLSATFDKPFEPYMRLIWDPLGPLLDVIFCNCEGYVTATEHSFQDYLGWVRRSQIDTDFFYAASGYTTADVQYMARIERLQREAAKRYAPATVTIPDLMQVAAAVRNDPSTRKESNQLGMEALVALYKLTDLYPADRPDGDGKYLLWATQQLLQGWGERELGPWAYLVEDQLAWLKQEGPPRRQAGGERLVFADRDIQGGILDNYGGGGASPVLHGALLLLRIADPVKARAFIRTLASPQQPDAAPRAGTRPADVLRIQPERAGAGDAERKTFLNLAFTLHGLERIGIAKAEIDRLPQEFREGMEERAGLLGDVRDNHPRNWRLPPRNWQPNAQPDVVATPVDMSEIDLVVQLRTSEDRGDPPPLPGTGGCDMDDVVRRLGDHPEDTGLELLSVEAMRRAPPVGGIRSPEHFGFSDGISQPRPNDGSAPVTKDDVPPGDLFLGYCNGRSDGPPPPSPILDNGTFLVMRKLSQQVGRLRTFVRDKAAELGIDEELLYAKMMGRSRDGTLLLPPPQPPGNDFTYQHDADGRHCPFQAHIRRTNPRPGPGERTAPRLLRRGLSFGPAYDENDDRDEASRGVFFMAYNASIAEQFEVIQRWINGGNSTGVASWQSDPLMGVGQHGDPRTFRFMIGRKTFRVDIPEPFVRLEWGAYLFVPSMSALRRIGAMAPEEQAVLQAGDLTQAKRGEEIVSRLLALAGEGPAGRIAAGAAWKTCLEDSGAKDPAEKDQANAVWAAIRLYHGGALKVPYGIVPPRQSPADAVLVASKDLVMRVFRDSDRNYSMCGQMTRMKQSFGEIFLGMDDGPEYREKSRINDTIFAISERQTFAIARGVALACIAQALGTTSALQVPECKIDLRRNFITPALAGICNRLFGIPDAANFYTQRKGNFVDPYGWSWAPAETRKPRCPGDYMATSRFCFYPDPIPRVRAYGKSHGQALRKGVAAYFDSLRQPGGIPDPLLDPLPGPPPGPSEPLPQGYLTTTMAGMFADNDELARNVIGVMTGFLPPADGCMRAAFYDWLDDKSLWRVQRALTSQRSADPYVRADKGLRPYLERAIQKRPAPDLLWRTATRDHRLGEVEVAADDRVFVSIVSALAEDAAAGLTDVCPVFGGERGKPESPLHACPAYKAAMGTMLGIVSALLESVRIEALPAPMLVTLSEPNPEMEARATAVALEIVAKAKAAAALSAGSAWAGRVAGDGEPGRAAGQEQRAGAGMPSADPIAHAAGAPPLDERGLIEQYVETPRETPATPGPITGQAANPADVPVK